MSEIDIIEKLNKIIDYLEFMMQKEHGMNTYLTEIVATKSQIESIKDYMKLTKTVKDK